MKSKFRRSALFGVLLIALSGCDIFTGVDSFPVSAVIDDVTYVSIPGVNYFQRSHDHTLMLERDYFSFSLQRELANTELGQRNIQIQVTEAFDGRVELNKKYNVSGLTRLFTPIDVGFYEHDAISGWVMFTEMTPSSLTDQSGTVYISGEFEIVFEGVNDGDVILAKDGYWGPSLFNYYYGYDKDVLQSFVVDFIYEWRFDLFDSSMFLDRLEMALLQSTGDERVISDFQLTICNSAKEPLQHVPFVIIYKPEFPEIN